MTSTTCSRGTRELDAQVARALGLDVVGVAWARPFPDGGGGWSICDREWGGHSLQPVWLAHCGCEFYPSAEPEWDPDPVLGHYPGCLEVIAFYSERIEVAWLLLETARAWKFSKRLRFFSALSDSVNDREGHEGKSYKLDWFSGLLLFLEPIDICLAFLAAMEGQSP